MSNRIIVTGAAGFVGRNIVRALNERGYDDIIAVDNLSKGEKFHNLVGLKLGDYIDKTVFYDAFAKGAYGKIEAVFHEGACSDTMEHDGRYMLANNYTTSRTLLERCLSHGTRLLYASSAATYGGSEVFQEDPAYEKPLNVYGYSKLLFDQVVRQAASSMQSQVAGFRYFNVYGPHEQHKGRMASVAYHHFHQFQENGCVKLFGAYGGYGPGEQKRDFLYIDDLVAVKLWFFDHPEKSGVFNLGSGHAEPFNNVALSVINSMRKSKNESVLSLADMQRDNLLQYTDFPQALVGRYQCFTEADLSRLRAAGCTHRFASVAQGVEQYMQYLLAAQKG